MLCCASAVCSSSVLWKALVNVFSLLKNLSHLFGNTDALANFQIVARLNSLSWLDLHYLILFLLRYHSAVYSGTT